MAEIKAPVECPDRFASFDQRQANGRFRREAVAEAGFAQGQLSAVTGHSSKAGIRRDADPQRPLTACVGGLRHLWIEALACRTRRVTNRIRSPR
jgi:hypothetical protein